MGYGVGEINFLSGRGRQAVPFPDMVIVIPFKRFVYRFIVLQEIGHLIHHLVLGVIEITICPRLGVGSIQSDVAVRFGKFLDESSA
jgi:hypothetical protein